MSVFGILDLRPQLEAHWGTTFDITRSEETKQENYLEVWLGVDG